MKSSTDCLWLTRYLLLHPRDRNSIQVICNERCSLFLQFLNRWTAHQMVSRILYAWILNCLFVISFWWKCLAFSIQINGYVGIFFCTFWFLNKKSGLRRSKQAANLLKKFRIGKNKICGTIQVMSKPQNVNLMTIIYHVLV